MHYAYGSANVFGHVGKGLALGKERVLFLGSPEPDAGARAKQRGPGLEPERREGDFDDERLFCRDHAWHVTRVRANGTGRPVVIERGGSHDGGPRKAPFPMSRSRVLSLGFLGLCLGLPGVIAACAATENFGGPPPCVGPQCLDGGGGGPVSLVPTSSGSVAPPVTGAASGSASAAPSGTTPTTPTPRASADIIDQGIEVALRQQALKLAPKGAMPDPQIVRIDLAEGEHYGVTYTLQPNVCYTMIAGAVPGVVKELEVKLLLPPFFTMEAGKGKGQPAAIGRVPAPICPISPIAIPYKVDVTATKGGGRVGLMVFAKPK